MPPEPTAKQIEAAEKKAAEEAEKAEKAAAKEAEEAEKAAAKEAEKAEKAAAKEAEAAEKAAADADADGGEEAAPVDDPQPPALVGENPFNLVYGNEQGRILEAFQIGQLGVVVRCPQGICYVENASMRPRTDGTFEIIG